MIIDVHLHQPSAEMHAIKKVLAKLLTNQGTIMSEISDFSVAQSAHNARVSTALGGIATDLKALNDKIAELQASSGKINAADQALLDDLQKQGEALAKSVEDVDGLTAPALPVTPASSGGEPVFVEPGVATDPPIPNVDTE